MAVSQQSEERSPNVAVERAARQVSVSLKYWNSSDFFYETDVHAIFAE